MKVETRKSNEEVFGIDIIADSVEDWEILQRFYDKGIKINGRTGNKSIQLTFRDLMDKDAAVIMLLDEALDIAKEREAEKINEYFRTQKTYVSDNISIKKIEK